MTAIGPSVLSRRRTRSLFASMKRQKHTLKTQTGRLPERSNDPSSWPPLTKKINIQCLWEGDHDDDDDDDKHNYNDYNITRSQNSQLLLAIQGEIKISDFSSKLWYTIS